MQRLRRRPLAHFDKTGRALNYPASAVKEAAKRLDCVESDSVSFRFKPKPESSDPDRMRAAATVAFHEVQAIVEETVVTGAALRGAGKIIEEAAPSRLTRSGYPVDLSTARVATGTISGQPQSAVWSTPCVKWALVSMALTPRPSDKFFSETQGIGKRYKRLSISRRNSGPGYFRGPCLSTTRRP